MNSEQLVRTCLERIRESPFSFVQVFEDSALLCAGDGDRADTKQVRWLVFLLL